MSGNQIYREAALERLTVPDRLEQGLKIVGSVEWLLITALFVLFLGAGIWSTFLNVPITVGGSGILLERSGLYEVTSASRGRIINFSISPGDQVRKGEIIAHLDQGELKTTLDAARAELADALAEQAQIAAFQQRRAKALAFSAMQKRQAATDHIRFLDTRLAQLHEQLEKNTKLASHGFQLTQRVLDIQLEIGQSEDEKQREINGLKDLDLESARQVIADDQERMQSEMRVAASRRKVDGLSVQYDREPVITSPYRGHVAELRVKVGEIVERGASLFTIIPDRSGHDANAAQGRLTAVIYVPSGEGKQIRPGMHVALAPSVAPKEEFGFLLGRVRWVAEVPATAEGMAYTLKNRQLAQTLSNNAAPFEVAVDLEADPSSPSGYKWSSSKGPEIRLNDGTLVHADFEIRKMPLLSLIIPPLRQFLAPVTQGSNS